MMVVDNKVGAVDLSLVVIINSPKEKIKSSIFSKEDLEYQEERRKRKVRKLDFEVR